MKNMNCRKNKTIKTKTVRTVKNCNFSFNQHANLVDLNFNVSKIFRSILQTLTQQSTPTPTTYIITQ